MDKAILQRIEEYGADFFVTGNEYMRDALDLKFIPREHPDTRCVGGGVVLADANQDLSQSFTIAKEVFEHVERGTIKFVLIGLSPYIIPTSDEEPLTAWDVQTNAPILEEYIKLCRDNGAKPVAVVFPVNPTVKKTYNADVLNLFRDTIKKVVGKYKANFLDLLDVKLSGTCFNKKLRLNSEGAAAVSALLGSKLYFANVVSLKSILDANNEYFNVLEKYFPMDRKKLINPIFCRLACDDYKRLSETLSKDDLLDLMALVFSDMTYEHLANLSNMLPKDTYNNLASRIFEISAEKIRCKDKIKLGFCFNYSAAWCGDDLYNLFANDKRRFETTIFFHSKGNYITRKQEFTPDLERFKSHGLNVVKVNYDSDIVPQDILIQLSPYYQYDPKPFQLVNLKVSTLMTYVPYGLSTFPRKNYIISWTFFRVLWKMFFTSDVVLKWYQKTVPVGMPRGVYSGSPKTDIFFKQDAKFHFDWKMTRPDAKKIIYAPHHDLANSNFRWHYQFMYEFAKAHPEISWVFKPHPNLLPASVRGKIFPSAAACEEYYQKWNALPNAQLYTGAYYQSIFATSDGMIQDCRSFIVEYQYVDKPMIYLTREDEKLNDLGKAILEASYTVDGRDLDAIAAMMQRVFIEGDDYKVAERKAVFDKYLNYPKANGMLASEFIYKNIADELKAVPT